MPVLNDLLARGRPVGRHRPWSRAVVDHETWAAAVDRLVAAPLSLLGLWAEDASVHMALLEGDTGEIGVMSLDCPGRHFPSVGRHHPPAIRLERAIRDLWRLEPMGLEDTRPWLRHDETPVPYPFLASQGEGLHQIPVGPVHAGIIEPGHFRFTANGETVVRLEARLGYVHKGVEALMAGADLDRAAMLAGRISGDATVAYQIAFARAIEAALGIEAAPRAQFLRALMAEMERIANHLGDIGAIANDAAFALLNAHCGVLRERMLRAAGTAFGHRLMRDVAVPGGVARDMGAEGLTAIRSAVEEVKRRFPPLVELYDNTTSLQDRTVATGILKPELALRYAAGGFVGRASGRGFDARRVPGYPPYDTLPFEVETRSEGDVNARVWIRIREVEQSLVMIEQVLRRLPTGELMAELAAPADECEGMALVESFRGDVLAWVRLGEDGRVRRCHLRDPSWFQWPLLEAAIEGNIVADFPLCNKSFNCSYSGHDL